MSEHNNEPGFEPGFDLEDTKQDTGVQKVPVEGFGQAKVTLITFEDVEEYQQGGEEGVTITAEQLADLFSSNYVEPDFSHLDAQGVREMKPTAPGRLLDAIIDPEEDVDVSVDAGGNAQISAGSAEGN